MKKIIVLLCVSLTYNMLAQNPNFILFNHTNAPFVNDSITWVEVDTNNVKWIGTRNGLYSFNNNTWTVYNTSNSNIPDNRIDKFKIAYDNTIWFVNYNKGFIKFKNNVFTLFNKNNLPGLPTDSLAGLTIDSNDVFFWSDNHGIVKFNSLNNVADTINLSNSYLKKIDHLIAHGNHMIYGLAKGAVGGAMPPQTLSDSILSVNDFIISNTAGMPISYCFVNWSDNCNYFQIMSDRFGNRYEMSMATPSSTLPAQSIRTYDKNNTLLSDVPYTQNPEKQIAKNLYGRYSLNHGGVDEFHVTIFNPSFSGMFGIWNTIIPSVSIINFDIDTLNNVWLATGAGLVGYNDLGVITKVHQPDPLPTISIFPNPAYHQLSIQFNHSATEFATMQFTDILGRAVAEYQLTTNNNNETKIDISMLPNGMYSYTIEANHKQLLKGKISIIN
ncbi:MAG: T9SS type A sorting domain-containing protein [Bacteroidetes bacterium]|nr:T9SS type A sorting domain-containing protein [Bacteroidota bacterium]